MEFNEQLFENIVDVGNGSDSDIFDQIEANEEKMSENADLYDVFFELNKVLEAPSRYNEIQSVDSALDVNKGLIKITGVCKHKIKANKQDLNRVEDSPKNLGSAYSSSVVDTFAQDLTNILPDNLKLEYEITDDTLPRMDKLPFTILITRKG